VEPCGYRALEGLRLERGYRAYGTDLTAADTPDEAGLAFCVDVSKAFVGRDPILAARQTEPPTRLRTLMVGAEQYLPIYGGEAVDDGRGVVGRVRSCAFGFTVHRNIALAYLPSAFGPGSEVRVEVFGELIPAEVAEGVMVDPKHTRVRS
jgi:glycine cleavage system aminomethyltransferase T